MKKLLLCLEFTLCSFWAFAQTAPTVTLNWTDTLNPSGTSYDVYRSGGPCGSASTFSVIATVATLSYFDATVTPGTYCYEVTAVLGGIESAPSNPTNTVVPSSLTMSLSPTAIFLGPAQAQQFAVTLSGSTSGVSWSLSPNLGTISSSGLYTAPASITTQQTIRITATSTADPTKSATATVTLMPTLSVTPNALALTQGQTQAFTATVAGTPNPAVTWSHTPAMGSLSTTGLYTAPTQITTKRVVTVTAVSMLDATVSATATVTLSPPVPASISASSGTPQSTTVSTAFVAPLQATVLDAGGNAVSGATVTFSTPTSGPGATFGGASSATSLTNKSGIAIAPTLTANAQAGKYTVTASVTGASPASFNFTNNAAAGGGGSVGGSSAGSLVGSGNSSSTPVNLTAEGTSDWEHWGEAALTRKAGVGAQLSGYTVLGFGAALAYSNDARQVSWTDGASTGSGAGNANGLYINGLGQGFAFTAPADTTARTLVVHMGGWYSGGTLTAHLSDGSAADFTDVNAAIAGQYDRNYALTYHAGKAGQTLTVSWMMTSGPGYGNVTLNAAALAGGAVALPTPPPTGSGTTSITASGGTSQSTTVNTLFGTLLQATVRDGNGNAVSGAAVTFSAPTSGPSGSFSGAASAAVATNASGVATAPAFTANGQAGGYTVSATVSGVGTPASFILTNNAAVVVVTGSLTGTGNSLATLANLTTEGASDWVHWGEANLNRKAGVSALLSNYTVVGSGSVQSYNNDPRPLSWTDGTPAASSAGNADGVYIGGFGQGFAITAPADTTTRTLVVHVGGWYSGGTLTARLSDGSAADFTDVTPSVNGQYDQNYTLNYHAAKAGQTLTVSWTMTSGIGYGNVTLSAAALH